jgi:hypothetical protein
MDPRHFSPKTKREAYKRSRGHCEKCTIELATGNIIYDHVIPWEISYDSSLENCDVICKTCDRTKTFGKDIPIIAKIKRLYDRAIGIERPKQKLPAGKDSHISKTVRGEVIRRLPRYGKHRAAMAKRQIGGGI